jgi:predicted Zn-dependent protease
MGVLVVSKLGSTPDRADAVGFFLITQSGFSPYEAGAALGKISMYMGDARETKFQELFQDHPMTPERIQHMHSLLAQYQTKR